jgi:hypothetical protein
MTHISEAFAYVKIQDLSGCWNWLRARTASGYGEANIGGRVVSMHRAVYEYVLGPIPEHLELDHVCRNRGCCNPYHLEPVTHRENVRRGDSASARLARATHCIAGHEFTPENTVIIAGGRQCRQCKNRRGRESWQRRFGIRGNAQSRKTHCPRGHEYSAENTYVHRGRRMCRTCLCERNAERRWRARQLK